MKIAVLGDVMLDKFTFGNVTRLNPEAPAQLINVSSEEFRLGGAANVAANIASLDTKVFLIGCIGDDYHGKQFIDLCNKNQITFHNIQNKFSTITKQRFIENTYKQQLLRVDYEEKIFLDSNQNNQIFEYIKNNNIDILVVSDYNKGIISKELIDEIFKLGIKVLVDCKPENIYLFKGAYLIKPNFKEFQKIILGKIENTDEDIELNGKEFVIKYESNLIVTRGSKGATLITTDGIVHHLHTEAQQVFDVTGAGDTFLGAISWALVNGYPLIQSIMLGNKASGIVVGKVGTATISKNELQIN